MLMRSCSCVHAHAHALTLGYESGMSESSVPMKVVCILLVVVVAASLVAAIAIGKSILPCYPGKKFGNTQGVILQLIELYD